MREKDLPEDEQIALVRLLLPIARRNGARLTLHGDAALAKAAGADGVHLLGAGDAAAARKLLGPDKLIGVSIHTATEAAAIDPAIADYAIAGPAYETASKPGYGPEIGRKGLADLAARARAARRHRRPQCHARRRGAGGRGLGDRGDGLDHARGRPGAGDESTVVDGRGALVEIEILVAPLIVPLPDTRQLSGAGEECFSSGRHCKSNAGFQIFLFDFLSSLALGGGPHVCSVACDVNKHPASQAKSQSKDGVDYPSGRCHRLITCGSEMKVHRCLSFQSSGGLHCGILIPDSLTIFPQ